LTQYHLILLLPRRGGYSARILTPWGLQRAQILPRQRRFRIRDSPDVDGALAQGAGTEALVEIESGLVGVQCPDQCGIDATGAELGGPLADEGCAEAVAAVRGEEVEGVQL